MTITVVEPRAAAPPGYGRAYASVPVQISRQGVLRPASLAQWRPFVPGTDDQYTGPLFGDAYSETPLSFPQRADERGLIQVWAPEPVRIEVGAWSDGYASVRHVLDLLFTEDFSQAEADGLYAPLAHTTAPDQHPEYLTTTEGDLRYQTLPLPPPVIPGEYLTQTEADDLYLPLSYVPPASGISVADADLRYVNTAGDTMTGNLTIANVTGASALTLNGSPEAPRRFSLQSNGLERWRLDFGGSETGSNAGSPFILYRFNDDGSYLGTALSLSRATGAATFEGTVTTGGNLAVAATQAPFGGNNKGIRYGTMGALFDGDGYTHWASNLYHNGGALVTLANGPSSTLYQAGASLTFLTAPSAAAGASPAYTTRLIVDTIGVNLPTGSLTIGAGSAVIGTNPAAAGAVRLPNGPTGNLAWRNAGNTADLTLGVDASDRLALAVGAGSLTTSATAGGGTALPATPTGYLTVVLNGSTVKVPYYS